MSKKVHCSDCGFLCWNVSDTRGEQDSFIKWESVSQSGREKLKNGTLNGNFSYDEINEEYYLSCLRRQWIFWSGTGNRLSNYIDINILKNPRKCKYFYRYEPGFGPEEHKQLIREEISNNRTKTAALQGALVGGAIGLIGTIIYLIIEIFIKK